MLEVPAVLSATSRLVVDCNRLEDAPSAIPELSDGTAIPGNRNLDLGERRRRHRLYARPYQDEVARRLARSGLTIESMVPSSGIIEASSKENSPGAVSLPAKTSPPRSAKK